MGAQPSFGYTADVGLDGQKLLNYHAVTERKVNPLAADLLNPTYVRRFIEYLTVQAEFNSASMSPDDSADLASWREKLEDRAVETGASVDIGGATAVDFPGQAAAVWRWDEASCEFRGDGVCVVTATLIAEGAWVEDTPV